MHYIYPVQGFEQREKITRRLYEDHLKIQEIISENSRRNGLLDAYYNPYSGEGSPIERKKLSFSDMPAMYLPVSMFSEPVKPESPTYDDNVKFVELQLFQQIIKHESLEDAAVEIGTNKSTLITLINNVRFDHDFEFWAVTCIKILDKDTFLYVPFKLRSAQRKLLKEMEDMRLSNTPIRIVLLKARQWGGSTLVEMYMMWIQQRHRRSWHMAICAHEDGAANNISEMYKNAAKNYPAEVGAITFRPYARSPKNTVNVERGGIIGIGSVNNTDQFRSYNYAMCHLSEVGVWKDTPQRKAGSLIASLKETVPDNPLTIIVEESTAKGINYFYDSWKRAVSGKSRYRPVFIPWFEIDRCRVPLELSVEEFLKEMNDYDRSLWAIGATLEGINWYNHHKADRYLEEESKGSFFSEFLMHSENPSTPEEAFQSAGEKRFKLEYIKAMEKDCRKYEFRGDVTADSSQGPKAFNNITFSENRAKGNLQVWSMPDEENKVLNRYCAYADIGGVWRGADYSVLVVIDRYWMLEGGDPEIVAVWHGHIDKDLFAWKAAQICKVYDNALLAFETNTYDKDRRLDDHFLTAVERVAEFYSNLYTRSDPEKVGDDYVPRWGFQMNKKTKPQIIDSLHAASRERYMKDIDQQESYCLIARDIRLISQMNWFEIKPDGSLGAIEGEKDDLVVSAAGALWLATRYMPMPIVVKEETKTRKKSHKTEASF